MKTIVAVVAMIGLACPMMAATEYTITEIDMIPGATSGNAYDTNNSGVIVGRVRGPEIGGQAFRWTEAEGMVQLALPHGSGGAQAFAVNDSGWIVGGSQPNYGVGQATIWVPGQAPRELGAELAFPEYYVGSWLMDVNNHGEVVGGYALQPPNASMQWHSFYWSEATGLITIDAFSTYGTTATGIDDSGVVVGHAQLNENRTHAFTWTPADGIADIYPDFPNRDYTANAINDAGKIAGQGEQANGTKVPTLWLDPPGEPIFANIAYGWAEDINDNGLIVGRCSYTPSGPTREYAFLWDGATTFNVLPGLGGNREIAEGVNDDGWIVGWARNTEGMEVPVYWTPEPATLSLLALGGLAVIRRGRK